MDKQKAIDEQSRDKIVRNINENYFVEAGAGSGKTTTLVERMVAIVEAGNNISDISAITFTKAAANEFYARFQKRLIERMNAPIGLKDNEHSRLNPPTIESKKYCEEALNQIDMAFMGTIDSFCNTIMSEHPNEGLIPSESYVMSDEEAAELYKREYTKILSGFYNDPSLEKKGQLFIHYLNSPEDTFTRTLNVLLSRRNCELVIPEKPVINIDVALKDEIKTIKKIVSVLDKNSNFINSPGSVIETYQNNIKRYCSTFFKSWDDNINNILYAFKDTFMAKNFRLVKSQEVVDALEEGIRYFSLNKTEKWYEPNDELLKVQTYLKQLQYQVTLDFVASARDLILQQLRRQGKLTFSDYLIYLRDTLKEDAKNGGALIKHIQNRHKYYLIDEFQDTDPIQAEIFFYLSAEKINEDWRKCIPYKGSLFIVGDPKQSIYRFKNADVASYLKVKDMFSNQKVGEVLYLYSNFRSTYELRDWFNDTFDTLFEESEDQSSYPAIPTDVSEKNNYFTGIFQYELPKKDEFDSSAVKEAKLIKDIILRLVDNPAYQISDGKGSSRTLTYKDFMIITPSKPKLNNFTNIFKSAGIPYYVEGSIKFGDCPALVNLHKLYGAICIKNDNRYLYASLKSAYFNISDKLLNTLREKHYHINLEDDFTETDIPSKLYESLTFLKALTKEKIELSPSSLFMYLIERVNIFEKVGNKNMEYLYFALELLKEREKTSEITTHKEAYDFLNGLLYENDSLERCPGFKKDGNQVHLANLHKVKGLEAPVVFLAGPSKRKTKPEFRLVRNTDKNLGYLFRVDKKTGNGGSINIIETKDYKDSLEEDEIQSQEAENIRLAYVAATRAKNVLIIASHKAKEGQYDNNPWKFLLSKELNNIEDFLSGCEPKATKVESIGLEDIKDTLNILENDKLLKESYELKRPSKLDGEHTYENFESDSRITKHNDEQHGDTFYTISGTLVHRLMELILISKDRYKKDDLIDFIINEYDYGQYTNKINVFKNTLSRVYETIHSGGYPQTNGCIDDILPYLLDSEEVYCEVPFSYSEDDILWNGIIDLLYKKDGKYHVIDWKTNKSDLNLGEHYKNQLEAYKKAIKKTSGIDVEDALIYHIDINNLPN